jgi:alpha-tubulin suppressor-like RCC1 family protein
VRLVVALLSLASCSQVFGLDSPSRRGGADADSRDAVDLDDTAAMSDAPLPLCKLLLGSDHSCSLRGGTVVCVGSNGFGELGTGATGGMSTTIAVAEGNVTAAASRYYHSCAVVSDGTGRCWGFNDAGQIGDSTMQTRPAPTVVMSVANIAELATGRDFSCARRTNGVVSCWGANDDGQLGDGTNTQQSVQMTNVILDGNAAVQLAGGGAQACALFSNGTGRCWGDNAFGQLGDNSQIDRSTPVALPVSDVRQIVTASYSTGPAVAGAQTCVLRDDLTVQCWGSNEYGNLGLGTMSAPVMAPATVNITSVVELAMGRYHVCARRQGGDVWCWGHNTDGQVGDGTQTDRESPTAVTLPQPAIHIAASGWHTCALLADQSAWCWGRNAAGQLGDSSTTMRTTPVASTVCSDP